MLLKARKRYAYRISEDLLCFDCLKLSDDHYWMTHDENAMDECMVIPVLGMTCSECGKKLFQPRSNNLP